MVDRRTMPAKNIRVNKHKKFITIEDKYEIVIIQIACIHFNLMGLNRYEVNLNPPR